MIDLIFCYGSNKDCFEIAYQAGFLLGICSGRSSYGYPIHFVDIDYKRGHFDRHLRIVGQYQPKYATVLDLSDKQVSSDDIERAMRQYYQLSNYCEIPLIVPKLSCQISLLPDHVAIGYSVPTSYGGAQYPIWELAGRRVHILGGNPAKQMEAYSYIHTMGTVLSADGNMAIKVARNYSQYWDKKWRDHPDAGSDKVLVFDCWRRSCENIQREWSQLISSVTI